MTNVAKAWTLAWAIMNDVDLPDEIPGKFLAKYPLAGFRSGKTRDAQYVVAGREKEWMQEEVERSVTFLKERLLLR